MAAGKCDGFVQNRRTLDEVYVAGTVSEASF
jgi:hypothetical protein